MTVTARSFAKINLGLRIGAKRGDGFHDLLTVYQTIALHDIIRVRTVRGSGIEIRCEDSRVPRDESNTCFRIVEQAMRALRAKGRVIVEIEKRLPVQGGLGGASSNAAAALLALERALKKSLSTAQRLRIAAEVGSDLPLFLIGGTVLGVGRGEQVYPLEDLPAFHCVIITPEIGVSTPKAFSEWDRLCGADTPFGKLGAGSVRAAGRSSAGQPGAPPPQLAKTGRAEGPAAVPAKSPPKLTLDPASDRMSELSCGLLAWLSEALLGQAYSGAPKRGRAENPLLALVRTGIENDFEQVVFPEYPELREVKSALVRAGAKYASLSGSGSTLYGLFSSRPDAMRAAATLKHLGWYAQATLTLPRTQYWRRLFA
jgi:4-diphosphocytidyl-2-C-methyl-D-erythritol kinase